MEKLTICIAVCIGAAALVGAGYLIAKLADESLCVDSFHLHNHSAGDSDDTDDSGDSNDDSHNN